MNPVVIAFDCDAGDVGVFEGLQGFYCFGECFRHNLADVEEIAADQNKVDFCFYGICDHSGQAVEEILVSIRFTCGGAIGFAEVDVGNMYEIH